MNGTGRIYDVQAATALSKDLLAETCQRRLPGLSKMSRDEMREIGYLDSTPPVDACRDVQ